MSGTQESEFFSASNQNAAEIREKLAEDVLTSLLNFLDEQGGEIAFFDATNTTRSRRAKIVQQCRGKVERISGTACG